MYKTSQKSKKISEDSTPQPSSFNICGIDGFLLLVSTLMFSFILFPILMASDGDSKIETALARAPFDLKGFNVGCGYAMDFERKCSIRKKGSSHQETVTIPVSGEAFPANFYVYVDSAGNTKVQSDLRGEFLPLATAQAQLSNEVHAVIAEYLERKKNFKPRKNYLSLTESEKNRNLESYQ